MSKHFKPIFHTCHIKRHHWLLPLNTTFHYLSWGHKVSTKQNLLTSFPHTHFNLSGWNWCRVEAIQAEMLILLVSEIYWIKGNNCCFTDNIPKLLFYWQHPKDCCFTDSIPKSAVLLTASHNFNAGMHLDIYELIRFKLGMTGNTKPYILVLVLFTLTLIQGHWDVRKQKPLHQLSRKVCSRFGWNFGILFRLADLMNLILFYLV